VAFPAPERWLIEGLWSAEAVGIGGGEPKCCKSFLALDMAVSVASGAPCLRRFVPARTGTVLLLTRRELRAACRMRTASLSQALVTLCADGRVLEHDGHLALPDA
jgi:hypothetical protein